MSAVSAMRVAPATSSTTERLREAWMQASAVVRRAAVAAMVTSGAVGTGVPGPWTLRVSVALVGMCLAAAALVDVQERRLPNRLLALAAQAALAGAVVGLDGERCWHALLGGFLTGFAMLVVHVGRGVGMGDVKMAAVAGASAASIALVAAPISVMVAAFTASAWGAMSRRSSMALGPALWFGWAAAVASTAAGWWT